ncbi:hypothetical protein HBI56_125080 [Parastagonospora nodorum]|uniref:IQ calmodulin-binding motif protein n=1 Tax=Phaeosphaeria nodorum (strain SN15 / ATCC MYA-4574 / FGSC 10173) TaxID=321614 RepID=A0A7U2I1P2_PHANO|nr:hypothetical protein HBH56_166400 [Parastagonospora nodorum]QRC98549.1 hypothetical protein JI435_046030 [Parastagonospora nodorum SN15]KAH3936124.1 hypothetical protein HBH54_029480 [Parastagonospora nodorum]KAH3948241.1 hypothetical protein HBH53_104260 [Parastagonospora nodorum]KAH3968815.1 hypothetical protein HBH51_128180 [Parastagonospora nodorum]
MGEIAPTDRESEEKAAATIQRNYRGYRERRQLKGIGLDASARWAEAVRDAKWRAATKPKSRSQQDALHESLTTPEQRERANSNAARQNWKRVGEIARRAGADDPESASETEDETVEGRMEHRKKRFEQRAEREKTAKMMDLQYFLEMVDQKHRYGSNLRAYHEQWKKADTNENFYYWLDHGEGKKFEHPTVSRERLEKEQVRYLSREERMNYLVQIDEEGRLCWAKNGNRINTTPEYKDSINGIVPVDDNTPAYGPNGQLISDGQSKTIRRSSMSSSSDTGSEHSDVEGEHYVNEDLNKAKGVSKLKHVSAATILNHLLRSSVKPNSWIFVADTSFRLYIGIKQSGAFQHSSFLHGARISAAGLVKIKDGQLRRLSPLSGHYRPPTKNFRAFVHSMQDNGVDMSHVSISRSYAVLVGLEAYVKTRRKFKHGVEHVKEAETKIVHPEEHKRKLEEQKDKSKSAERERQILARKAEMEEAEKREQSWRRRMWKRLSRGGNEKDELAPKERDDAKEQKRSKWLSKSGQDVESAIPPDGRRDKLEKRDGAAP